MIVLTNKSWNSFCTLTRLTDINEFETKIYKWVSMCQFLGPFILEGCVTLSLWHDNEMNKLQAALSLSKSAVYRPG